MTYGEIAKELAKHREISRMSAQAVGGAVGKNEKRNKNSIFMPIRKI